MTYVGPASTGSQQKLAEVLPCLAKTATTSKVVAGCQNADYVRNVWYYCVFDFNMEVSCLGSRKAHDTIGELTLWHGDVSIYNGAQM